MRLALAVALVMVLGGTAAAEMRATATVGTIDDADGTLTVGMIEKAMPKTVRCFGKRPIAVQLVVVVDGGKVTSATPSEPVEPKDAKINACVAKLVAKMKLPSSHARIELAIAARDIAAENKKILDRIVNLPLGTSLGKFSALPPGGAGSGVGIGTGASAGSGGGTARGDVVAGGSIHTGSSSTTSSTVDSTGANGQLGGYTLDEINNVFKARAGVFRACYQRELNRTPAIKVGGKITFDVTIDDTGTVAKASVKSSTLKSDALASCLVSNIKRLRFPAKGQAFVVYPMIFASE